MPATTLLTAALVFLAVALGTVSLALLLEWAQERFRARNVVQKLRDFSEKSFGVEAQSLMRQQAGVSWLERVAGVVPSLRGITGLLHRSGSTWSVQSFLLVSLGLAVGLGLAGALFSRSVFLGILLVPPGALIPYLLLRHRARRRKDRLEEQLPDAIDLLGRAMRAGHPLSAGFSMVADEAPEPVATEFRQTFEEQRFGLPFDDSLLALAERMASTDARILVTAITVHRQVGGNLAEILDNIAFMVRERFKLRRQLRVITAQGRLSGYVLAALPIVLGLALWVLNPEYMLPLLQEDTGRYLLAGAAVFQVVGYLWIRRILDIEL
jgi:tight adherence protein B